MTAATSTPFLGNAGAAGAVDALEPPDGGRSSSPPSPRPATADVRALSRSLFLRLRTLEEGTPEYSYVRATLVEQNLTLVRYAARRFPERATQHEDILQAGTIGLIKAIDRFDPERGEFPAFALPTIFGEIKRFFRDTSWAVHVPRRLQELRLGLAKATDRLTCELGREPTNAELADALGLSVEDVEEGLAAAQAYTAGSIDPPPGAEEDHTPIAERMGFIDPRLDGVENHQTLVPLVKKLSYEDRLLLGLRFCEDLTQAQIAERLGCNQVQVSRRLSRLFGLLRPQLLGDG